MIGKEKARYLFLRLIIENKAIAVIGVKFGGWGTNRDSTTTTMIAITKYILLILYSSVIIRAYFF